MATHPAHLHSTTVTAAGEQPSRRRLFFTDALGPHTWIALGGALLLTLVYQPAAQTGGWLWALALFFIGMPHGAYDLHAIRHRAAPFDLHSHARIYIVYTLVMLGCVAAIMIAPAAGMIAFLALTAHHFGHSDSVWTRYKVSLNITDRLAAWGHGSVVVAAPFAFSPAAAWAPFGTIASMLGGQTTPSDVILRYAAAILLTLAIACVGLGLARLVTLHRQGDVIKEAIVLLLTLALAAVAPPLVAVGVYFLAVHALGHCLTASTPPRSNATPPSLANVYRVHLRSLPLLLPSIVIVFASTFLFSDEPSITNRIGLAFLLFCIPATLPHHLMWAGSRIIT